MKYLLPKARNNRTGQTVKAQDLTGGRFRMEQREICQAMADQIAQKMSVRTGDPWTGFIVEYTPTQRRSSV